MQILKTFKGKFEVQNIKKFRIKTDIDECRMSLSRCDLNTSYCHNTPGSYECKCLGGFLDDGGGGEDERLPRCVDIDECGENKAICGDLYLTCVNTYGGYRCDCLDGFSKTNEGVCLGKKSFFCTKCCFFFVSFCLIFQTWTSASSIIRATRTRCA